MRRLMCFFSVFALGLPTTLTSHAVADGRPIATQAEYEYVMRCMGTFNAVQVGTEAIRPNLPAANRPAVDKMIASGRQVESVYLQLRTAAEHPYFGFNLAGGAHEVSEAEEKSSSGAGSEDGVGRNGSQSSLVLMGSGGGLTTSLRVRKYFDSSFSLDTAA